MPRTRRLLLRWEVRAAGKQARCAHNKNHLIAKGETRFVVKDTGPMGRERGYCRGCAEEILRAARDELGVLEEALGRAGVGPSSSPETD
jgi:hypothetical protein